jgi:tRNA (cmo5U34)-methyltransferase
MGAANPHDAREHPSTERDAAREWSDPARVGEYLKREIPHRETAEQLLLEALPERIERFVDLGTGDGKLLALVAARHPQAHATGLDSSRPMLDRACERFAGTDRVVLLEHDLAQPLPIAGPLDAVVSSLAVHHLEHERKRSLFEEAHRLLRPDGVFANLDLVDSPTLELHERFRHAIGRPRDDPSDRLAGMCEQLDWLHAAGFAQARVDFKWLELTLFVAVKTDR